MKRWRALLAAAIGAGPLAAIACGACIEDKVAATYDHAVVARAASQGRVVVFAEPQSSMETKRVSKALEAAAARTPGIERASIRTAQSPAALSFALDRHAGTPDEVLERIQRAARIPGLRLSILKVIRPEGIRPDPRPGR